MKNAQDPAEQNPNTAPLPCLRLEPRRGALLAGHDNTLDVLVRIEAPAAPADAPARPPLHLTVVVDRSGSMSGPPLVEARRCAEFLLDHLRPQDRLALVAYDDTVQTLVPAGHLRDTRETLRAAIRQLDSGGSTDLHGGWLAGVRALAPHVTPDSVSRVILLSDGCANHGLCDPQAIWNQCAAHAGSGIATSTYGLGQGFNEDLMIGMARAGHGRSYYGQSAEDLMDPFREEFDLLSALCARRPQLEVRTVPGVKATLLNDYVAAGEGSWWLPDLAFGSEAWAIVRLKVKVPALTATRPATGSAGEVSDPADLVSVSVRYVGLDGEPRAIQPVALALPVLQAAAFGAVSENERVARRVAELEAAQLQRRARLAALQGDWHMVAALLRRAEKLGADNPWIAAIVEELHRLAAQRDQVMFAKQSAYSSRSMASRLAAVDESSHDAAQTAGPTYVRRKANPGKADPPATPPRA